MLKKSQSALRTAYRSLDTIAVGRTIGDVAATVSVATGFVRQTPAKDGHPEWPPG